MGSSQQTDLRTQPIPQSWQDAAAEAPGNDGVYGTARRRRMTLLPLRRVDMATAGFATAAMSMISGYAWYMINGNGITSPWIVVAVGVLIAMTLRLSAGEGERPARAMMALAFYVITVSGVLIIIARRDFEALYGASPTFGQLEQELVHGMLAPPMTWVAIAVGAVATVVTSKLL